MRLAMLVLVCMVLAGVGGLGRFASDGEPVPYWLDAVFLISAAIAIACAIWWLVLRFRTTMDKHIQDVESTTSSSPKRDRDKTSRK